MDNFFNYISKQLKQEDIEVWFNINNIIPEKMELYYDFSVSIHKLILETYLGDDDGFNETKVLMSEEDKVNHFDWCWDKTIDSFNLENIVFNKRGEHYEYFQSFFSEIYYNQSDNKIKNSISVFFRDVFDLDKPFTQSDLDMILNIYRSLDKNLVI